MRDGGSGNTLCLDIGEDNGMKTLYDKLQVLEQKNETLEREARLKAIVRPLLSWYESHARRLPWREDPKPYRVWISEIMLQQTRVEAVKPYFERFMEELPTVEALAHVDEERLLKLWEGLGYYNRARNLKKAAQKVMEQYDGKLPASYEELLTLPGIGSYTAGAVASIAYDIPLPAVDGNVLRVLSRVLGSREDIGKQSVKRRLEEDLKSVIPTDEASHFNQGLIEIGALVCVPGGKPKCESCPFESICLANIQGTTDEIPVKKPKKARRIEKMTVLVLESQDRIAVRRRPDTGLLASLYELPNLKGHKTLQEVAAAFSVEDGRVAKLADAKHIFSHVEWHMTGYWVALGEKLPEDSIFVSKQEIKDRYPLPNAFYAYTKLIN